LQSEKEIQKEILDALLKHPKVALIWQNDLNIKHLQKYGGIGKYRPKGLPDIAGILKGGRAILFEVKTMVGKTSAEQDSFLFRASQAGALTGIIRSVDEATHLIETA